MKDVHINTTALYVTHGKETHPLEAEDSCAFCVRVIKEYKQMVRKCGGKKKFIERLAKGLEEPRNGNMDLIS